MRQEGLLPGRVLAVTLALAIVIVAISIGLREYVEIAVELAGS